jgi:hypothetical protein
LAILLERPAGRDVCASELAGLHDVRLVKWQREAKHIYYSLSDTHVLRLVEIAMEYAAEKQ